MILGGKEVYTSWVSWICMNGKYLSAQNWVLGGGVVHCIRIYPKNFTTVFRMIAVAKLVCLKLPGFHGEISEFYWKIHWKIQRPGYLNKKPIKGKWLIQNICKYPWCQWTSWTLCSLNIGEANANPSLGKHQICRNFSTCIKRNFPISVASCINFLGWIGNSKKSWGNKFGCSHGLENILLLTQSLHVSGV